MAAISKSLRRVVDNTISQTKWLRIINLNFKELFDPVYFYGSTSSADLATIVTATYRNWTPVPFSTFTNKSSVSQRGTNTIFDFPFFQRGDTGKSSDGLWAMLATIGFDNQTASLQTHMRRVKIEQDVSSDNSGTWWPFAIAEALFDPSMLSGTIHDEEKVSPVQCYFQAGIGFPANVNYKSPFRVSVWHNAKVGGSGVSLNIVCRKPNAVTMPRLDAVKLCGEVDS